MLAPILLMFALAQVCQGTLGKVRYEPPQPLTDKVEWPKASCCQRPSHLPLCHTAQVSSLALHDCSRYDCLLVQLGQLPLLHNHGQKNLVMIIIAGGALGPLKLWTDPTCTGGMRLIWNTISWQLALWRGWPIWWRVDRAEIELATESWRTQLGVCIPALLLVIKN